MKREAERQETTVPKRKAEDYHMGPERIEAIISHPQMLEAFLQFIARTLPDTRWRIIESGPDRMVIGIDPTGATLTGHLEGIRWWSINRALRADISPMFNDNDGTKCEGLRITYTEYARSESLVILPDWVCYGK